MLMSSDVTIYVVDDSAAVREGIHALLTSVGFRVETCPHAEAFHAVFDPDKAGVLILDIRLGGSNGLDLQEALLAENVDVPVIIITAYGTVPTAVRAMRAGAIDVLQKPFAPRELVKRVRQAVETRARHRAAAEARAALDAGVDRLTPREQEVLGLSVAGKTARQIADILGMSVRTVEGHRAHILGKMGGRPVGQLAEILKSHRP
jgi:FixJ family two-component response regulator